MTYTKEQFIWIILRFVMGIMFLWAFLDKVFGLGFSTCRDTKTQAVTYLCEKAWLKGGLITKGYLGSSIGPLADFFKGIAGNPIVEWLFMIGLLAIGLSMILGIGMKIAGYSGAVMVILMAISHFPPTTNPLYDQHLLEALIFIGLAFVGAGDWIGLGKWWGNTTIVKKYSFLK